jgi:hypothetical protein
VFCSSVLKKLGNGTLFGEHRHKKQVHHLLSSFLDTFNLLTLPKELPLPTSSL